MNNINLIDYSEKKKRLRGYMSKNGYGSAILSTPSLVLTLGSNLFFSRGESTTHLIFMGWSQFYNT
jgi:hypothetical protein